MKGKRGPQPHGNGKRKRWSAAEKLRIVLEGMEPGVEVSELCRREALSPAQYYTWKRTLLGAAERIFVKKETQPSGRCMHSLKPGCFALLWRGTIEDSLNGHQKRSPRQPVRKCVIGRPGYPM